MRAGIILWFVITSCFAGLGFAQTDKEPAKPKPLVILYERNPWLMVIGSDSPTFALYENGLVIFLRERDGYVSAVLAEYEIADFMGSLHLDESFYGLNQNYDASEYTDQPTNVLKVWVRESAKEVTVYGALRNNSGARSTTPAIFLTIFDVLVSYKNVRAKPWIPRKIEVMVWPFEYSREKPVPWPIGWPDLNHPETKKRKNVYSIFLDAQHLQELKKLVGGLRAKQALLINGKKWTVSARFPFPHE